MRLPVPPASMSRRAPSVSRYEALPEEPLHRGENRILTNTNFLCMVTMKTV